MKFFGILSILILLALTSKAQEEIRSENKFCWKIIFENAKKDQIDIHALRFSPTSIYQNGKIILEARIEQDFTICFTLTNLQLSKGSVRIAGRCMEYRNKVWVPFIFSIDDVSLKEQWKAIHINLVSPRLE